MMIFDHLSSGVNWCIALFRITNLSIKESKTRQYEIDQEELSMRSIHRGWCCCTHCYMRHRNEQQLYEQESSDHTSVLEADYDWMFMIITPHDISVSLNPPVAAASPTHPCF